jgi:hypothetical protein
MFLHYISKKWSVPSDYGFCVWHWDGGSWFWFHGVNGTFDWRNPSGRTMALELTQTLNRNEYQEYFLGGKGGRCVGLTALTPSCADCLEIWEP